MSSLWLVKVPRHLAESWQQQPSGHSLGVVEPGVKDAMGRDTYTLRTSAAPGGAGPSSGEAGGDGVEYKLTLGAPTGGMYSFAPGGPDAPAGEMVFEGRVTAKGDVSAAGLSAGYKQLVRSRQEAASVRAEVEAVDVDQLNQPLKKKSEIHRQKQGVRDGKRERAEQKQKAAKAQKKLSREELRDLVFEKFELQPHWHKADLASETGQRPTDLAPVLDELCEREKFGPHKMEYKLKPQYGGGAR